MHQMLKDIKLKDIAKECDVSIGTVSRVVNNLDYVKPSTYKKVMRVVKKYGYIPNNVARSLRTSKTNTIGLLITDITYPFFPKIIQGIESEATKQGYNVLFSDYNGDVEREAERLLMLKKKNVDGIIAAPIDDPENNNWDLYLTLKKQNFPLVLLNYLIDINTDFIGIDDYSASEKCVEYLINLGHRRIAFIHDVFARKKVRLNGYRSALMKYGIPFDEHLIFQRDLKIEGIKTGIGDEADGYNLCKKVLDISPRATAIFCSNDAIAIGACKAIFEANLKIPDDISIIGFDNIPITTYLRVPLTTVSQPMYQIGENAFSLLLDQIKSGGENQTPRQVMLKAELVIRESCCPPQSTS